MILERAAKTISAISVALRDEGHRGPIEQGFRQSPTRLMSTDSSMLATTTKFLQDGARHDDFGVNVGSKGTCFINHAPKLVLPKPRSGESRRLDASCF